MAEIEIKRTNCKFCAYLCGLEVQVRDGRVVSVAPDTARFPYDESILKSCPRFHTNLEFLDHPTRLNHPFKQVGVRGNGIWQRITWDQALDEIAERLQRLKDVYGPETLATSIGGPHTAYWPMHRFMNLFGSPNNIGIGQICWNPSIWVNTITYGWPLDYELVPGLTQCAIIWGMNPAESDNSLFWRTVLEYASNGGNLIVVDPRRTRTARQATLWLPVRPGGDAALALGLLKVVIEDSLYDKRFVQEWCSGFEELKVHVSRFSLDEISHITDLPVETITQAARLYALHPPATIISGRGIDQLGPNSIPSHRSIAILRAITGNIDQPGASHLAEAPHFIAEIELELSDKLDKQARDKQLGRDRLLLQSYAGYERVQQETGMAGKRLPERYLTSAHPNLVWWAMLTGEPYPIRAMIVMGNNPLCSQADTRLVYQALQQLDLLVVLDMYTTPTAMLADYQLPVAGAMEVPLFQSNAGTADIAYGGDSAISPLYERRADFDFWRELGIRLGQGDDWPWLTYGESLEATLAPAGINWDEFCQTGLYYPEPVYQKHLQLDPIRGNARGFATPSGKIEIRSQILAGLGYEPLPIPKPVEVEQPGFPLQLITGARKQPYLGSAFRQLLRLRQLHPLPQVQVCLETAHALGLQNGDLVWVETVKGRAQFELAIAEMRQQVVSIEYGWWYPETLHQEPQLGGLWLSNANLLTSADFEDCEPLLGQWQFNALACRMYPVKPEEVHIRNGTHER